jgi:ribose-phosphate pyrophosphokinase
MLLFALRGAELLGARVAAAGGAACGLAPHEERDFARGEHKARPLVAVQGRDVYVLAALQGDAGGSVNDRLVRLLFFAAACRDHGAARVTAVVPVLPYARKDRQTKPSDPVSSRYVAQLLEALGIDRVVTLDVHNPAAFQNAFRCPTHHLTADRLLAADIAARTGGARRPRVVMSPDPGGIKRAQLLGEALEAAMGAGVGLAFLDKRRSAGRVSGEAFAGEVAGAVVHVRDDMACGGGTLRRAAEAARARGAAEVHAVVTHGLFDPGAAEGLLAPGLLDSLTLTDSAAPFHGTPPAVAARLRVLGVGPLLAGAILHLHDGRTPDPTAGPRLVSPTGP